MPYDTPWGSQIGWGASGSPTAVTPTKEKIVPDDRFTKPGQYIRDSLLDPNTGLLKSQYNLSAGPNVGMTSNLSDLQSRLGGINLNTQGLEAIRSRALGTGNSPWANMMLEKQGVEQANARDVNAKTGAGAARAAMSDLSMRGGLSGGARERLAMQSDRDIASGAQGVARQGVIDRLGIQTQDEATKNNMLTQLPGMEVASLQPEIQKTQMWQNLADSEGNRKMNLDLSNRDYGSKVQQFNIQNALGEKKNSDDALLAAYQEQMKAYGAQQTADATEKSGGGTWLCTEISKVKKYTNSELKALTKLVHHLWEKTPSVADFYLNSGGAEIISKAKLGGFNFRTLIPFIENVISLVKIGKIQRALVLYCEKIVELERQYCNKLPEKVYAIAKIK